MKPKCSRSFPSVLIVCGSLAALFGAPKAYATSATWNGTTDALWSTTTNWTTSPVPGAVDTATFNNAGGTLDTINIGTGLTLKTLLFDTASAAAYTIGSGAVNSQTLILNNAGAITMNSTVVNNEVINAAITLGTDKTLQTYTFTNNSTTNSLTLAGTITGDNTTGVAGVKTLAVAGAGAVTLGGAIANGGATSVSLTKSGGGTLTLSVANSFTGATTISGGTLILGHVGALASSASVSVASGAMLQAILGSTYTNSATVTIAGNGVGSNHGALDFSNAGTFTTVWTAPIALSASATLHSYGSAPTVTLSSAISGTGPLSFSSRGGGATNTAVWNLNAASTYTGNTTIFNDDGLKDITVKLGINNALPVATSLNLSGAVAQAAAVCATLDLNGFSQTLAGLTDSGASDSNAASFGKRVINSSATLGTLTINNSGAITYGTTGTNVLAGTLGGTTAAGVAANNLALTKTGAGVLTLAGANTYTGDTLISYGQVALGNALALQNSTYNTTGSTGAIGLNVTGYATPTLGGVSGSVNLATAITGYGSVSNLILNPQSGSDTYSGVIADGVSGMILTKTGAGTQMLSGANSYTGGTALNVGVLSLLNTTSKPASGAIVVAAGATLGLGVSGASAFTPSDVDSLFANTLANVTMNATSSVGIDTTNGDFTYGSSVASTGRGLNKLGGSTLILTGTNSYSGGTLLSGGTLQVGNAGTTGNLGSGAVTITAAGTTLAFNRTDAVGSPFTVSNDIIGSNGKVPNIVVNSGAVQLGGAADNSYATADVKSGATLILAKASSSTPDVHALGGNSTVESGGTLQLAGSGGDQIYSGVALTVASGGVFDMNSKTEAFASLSLAGTGISSGGALINSNTAATSTLSAAVVLTASSSMGGSGSLIADGWFSGGKDLTKVGSGTVTLSGGSVGTRSQVGTLETSGGILNVSGYLTTTGSGTLLRARSSGAINLSGDLLASGAYISIADGNTAGTINITGGTTVVSVANAIFIGKGGATGALNISGGSLTVTNTAPIYLAASFNGGADSANTQGSITVSGSGIFDTGTNLGAFTLGNGTLNTIKATVNLDGGTLATARSFTTTNAAVISTFNFNGGTLKANAANSTFMAGLTRANVRNGGAYIDTTGGSVTIGQALVHSNIGGDSATDGGLTKIGANTLTLTGLNTFTGDTLISGGKVALGNTLALQYSTYNTTGSTGVIGLDVTGYATPTLGGLSGSVDLATAITGYGSVTNLILNPQSGTDTYAGIIADGFSGMTLTKSGAGTQVLSGANSYTGLTDVQAGTLTLGHATDTLADTAAVQVSGGTLAVPNTDTVGAVTLSSGTISGAGTLTGSSYVLTNTGTISANLSGTGIALTKTGSGTAILSGANTYTGATAVTAGILQLGVAGALGNGTTNTSGVTVSNLAALDLNSLTPTASVALNLNGTTATGTVGALTNSTATAASYGGAVTLQSASSIGGSGGNITLSNTLGGAFGLTKVGSDTLILTGASNASTTTTISAGTLQIGNATTTGALGSSTVNNSGTLTINRSNAFSIASGNSISGTGGLTQAGSGTTTVNSANTYTGATAVTAGILQLGVAGALGNGTTNTSGVTVSNLAALDLNSLTPTASVALNLNGTTATGTVGALTNSTATAASYGGAVTLQSASSIGGSGGNITLSNTLGGAFGLTKVGSDTLILTGASNASTTTTISAGTLQIGNATTTGALGSGAVSNSGKLVFNRSNTYTLASGNLVTGNGGVILASGTIASAVDNQFNTSGALTIGSAAGASTIANLDLTNGSSIFGSLNVQTNTATANTVTIGSGKLLTVNNGFIVGVDLSAALSNSTTNLTLSGAGGLTINTASQNLVVGLAQASSAYSNAATLDLTGLAAFNATLNELRVGYGQTAAGLLKLSNTTNTISATAVQVGNSNGGNSSTTPVLTLGAGTNVIATDAINIGTSKSNGAVTFASTTSGSAGTVTISGKTGSKTNFTLASNVADTGFGPVGTLDLRGHVATITAGTVILGDRLDNAAGSSSSTGTIYLDGGTLSADTVIVGRRTGTGTSNSTGTGTINVSGGTLTVNTAFTLATQADTTNGTANGNLVITGGAVVSNVAILDGGGTNSNSKITLNGGTLDLTGHAIGDATNAITTLEWQSGTLWNVLQINNGAGLTKTTSGTLVLAGTNTYSGATTVNLGTLKVGASGAIPNGTGQGNVVLNGGATAGVFDVNGFNTTINGLAGTTGAVVGQVVNNSSGAKTLTVGNGNATGSFAGVIKDNSGSGGTLALTKTGSGTQTLSGANTYSGLTTISGGSLALGTGGSITNSSGVALNSGNFNVTAVAGGTYSLSALQALTGSGSVTGNLDVAGHLAIGSSPGTIDFSGNLGLDTSTVSDFQFTLASFVANSYDLAHSTTGTVSFGGILNLLFDGSTAYTTNTSVKIFDFAGYAGSFSTVNFTGLATGQEATFDATTGLVTVIPEPRVALLGGLGLLALLRRRRQPRCA